MILNLLEQAGLSARVDGEYLQGGVGELQAIGIVRVMVDDEDYLDAKAIIKEWDENQPVQDPKRRPEKKQSRIGLFIGGIVCGAIAMSLYYHTPVTEDGVDNNGDGRLDEKWTYVNHLLSKTEIDRNFDGKIDFISKFDRKGLIYSSYADEDFNGTFETEISYENGNPVEQVSDTTGDGFNDYKISFEYGAVETASFIDPSSKKTVKVQHFGPFKLEKAEVDTNGDGRLDSVYEYNSIEERAQKSNNSSKGAQ